MQFNNQPHTPLPLPSPSFINFAEERLELGYDYGAVGGMTFATEIIETYGGQEQRNSLTVLPTGRWQLGSRRVADIDDKLKELTYLKEFHLARQGSYQGFRFKDWSDYFAQNQYIGTGDGTKTQFQLRKAYKAGNAVTYRPITKPVENTVIFFVDGVSLFLSNNYQWQLDYSTGVITFDSPLPSGAVLTAEFEFDVPVWFESDKIDFRLLGYEPESSSVIYELGSVFVTEGKIPLTLPWIIEVTSEITENLDLGIIYESTEEYAFSTNKLELRSGYVKKSATQDDAKINFNLGERKYDRAELETLIGYFWNAKGRKHEFPFTNLDKNYRVRFDSDRLSIKFEAAVAETKEALFSLSDLKLKMEAELIFKLPPYSIEATPIFIDPKDTSTTANLGDSAYSGSLKSDSNSDSKSPKPYNIKSFLAQNIAFDMKPPGETGNNVVYYAKSLFWAGDTLNILVSPFTSFSVYYRRLVHYRLDSSSGWNFIYQSETSEALRNYVIFESDIETPKISLVENVTIVLFRARYEAFGSSGYSVSNLDGLLNMKITRSGTTINFNHQSAYGLTNLPVPMTVYGDRLFLYGNPYSELGVVDGYKVTISPTFSNNTSGYPISQDVNPEREYEFNIWRKDQRSTDSSRIIYHGSTPVVKYFPRASSSAGVFFSFTGEDGSYLFTFRAYGVCETKTFDCDFADSLDAIYFFLKPNYYSEPELIDVQKRVFGSDDSYYIQTPTVTKKSCDRLGNALVVSNKVVYYRSGSGYGIDITAQLGVSSSQIQSKPAVTPYGFALISHRFGLFAPDTNLNLFFVQND